MIGECFERCCSEFFEEHRSIIEGSKKGYDFILERNLKSGSIFISAHTEEVYLVSGIILS